MKLTKTRNIFFTGFMASGKSRIGALTAASLGWKFFDTDKLVEEKTGKTIPQIFAEQGEAAFRKLELETLREICASGQMVASLGGGTLLNPEAIELIRKNGVLIGLRASPEVILERVNRKKESRPLLADLDDPAKLEKIKSMLAERQPLYDLANFQFESEESLPHHVFTRRIIHRLLVEELDPLWVELGERRYPIYIGEDLSDYIDSIAEKTGCPQSFAVVSDQNVQDAQGSMLEHLRTALGNCPAFYWKSGEPEKNLTSIQKLLTWLLRQGFSRKSVLVACGGGVVGDMTGFAASIFLRGIPFIQVPTTLLSMVDSSVGGKTGVNHPLGKNLIGAFHQPRAVIISLNSLKTLPREQYLAGLAEVVKYAIIRDMEFFAWLEQNADAVAQQDMGALQYIVRRSCAIKAAVVGNDEREMDERGRAVLNYGHTFGHAFENLSEYRYPHGLAVALGMRCAARLSGSLGMLSAQDVIRHDALLDRLNLPRHFSNAFDMDKAFEAMSRDKKASSGRRVFIVPKSLGEAVPVVNPPEDAVRDAFKVVLGDHG
ncbi:MAG TPA: 3-dehydroquinate synthase [Fibrobacteres bacterium]|jgi:shikimate kinase/3-dehydroquinate synthase|nr:3-dehydroquinate synthase [Fibrobacterota bacterium]